MRQLRSPIAALAFLVFTSGCTGYFERELELVDVPYERQLVLNTVLSPQDSLIRADVYVTAPIVGEFPADFSPHGRVDDAQITLVGPTETFSFEPKRQFPEPTYVLAQAVAQLEPGMTYEVIAEWDGLSARGRTTIPQLSIPRDSIILEDASNDQERRIRVVWPNLAGEQDYYLVSTDQELYDGPGQTRLQRELVDYLRGRDALGAYITTRAIGVNRGTPTLLNVCQTGPATYDYLVTRQTLQVNADNPFAEPTTVANNLDEGLGLVGAANCWQIAFQ